jgi:membrane protein YdbS with pleckstrin-like domain
VSRHLEEATVWVYRGVWGILTQWFHVPAQPPTLPVSATDSLKSFRPAPGFLRYLKLQFWLALAAIDLAIAGAWIALYVNRPTFGLLLAPVALALAVIPDIVAYLAIHLRYDTTWYVFTDRSLRLRRGIWVIHETTITFENIQNVSVNSGPLERFFGIANVVVDTAGGGKQSKKDGDGKQGGNTHQGVIEGIDNAEEIRNQILNRLRHSRSAGLGDDAAETSAWSSEHIRLLTEIRDALTALPADQRYPR